MESCVVDGVRCTKCCEAIAIDQPLAKIKVLAGLNTRDGKLDSDNIFIYENWTPISRRAARKINPYLVDFLGVGRNKFFYKCKKVTDQGCSIHKDRPKVCSGYLRYELDDESWETRLKAPPMYTKDCTEYRLDIKQIKE